MTPKIHKLFTEAGLELVEINSANGHWQVRGGNFLVNWWPESRMRTAHVDKTRKGKKKVTPEDVIRMATEVPEYEPLTERRKVHLWIKKNLWVKQKGKCHWCGEPMSREVGHPQQQTLDHVIPLSRGGQDNRSNIVLACMDCNQKRGSDMPEVENNVRS